jgi:hypothetical protein
MIQASAPAINDADCFSGRESLSVMELMTPSAWRSILGTEANMPPHRVQMRKSTHAPNQQELTELVHTISHRVAGFLEREGILERDEENSYLNLEEGDEDPMQQVLGCSVSYRIAIGPQQGRKVFTPGHDLGAAFETGIQYRTLPCIHALAALVNPFTSCVALPLLLQRRTFQ